MVQEAEHYSFHLDLRHLSMPYGEPGIRRQFSYIISRFFYVPYPVMDEKYLAIPSQFSIDSLLYSFAGIGGYDTPDCNSFLRRGLNSSDLPDARQRHMQCPWNRRCCEGKDIDPLFKLFKPLLLGHTKAVLFVDDQQPDVMKMDLLVQEHMCSDNYICFTVSQGLD